MRGLISPWPAGAPTVSTLSLPTASPEQTNVPEVEAFRTWPGGCVRQPACSIRISPWGDWGGGMLAPDVLSLPAEPEALTADQIAAYLVAAGSVDAVGAQYPALVVRL